MDCNDRLEQPVAAAVAATNVLITGHQRRSVTGATVVL
jgi:hypothetical protein